MEKNMITSFLNTMKSIIEQLDNDIAVLYDIYLPIVAKISTTKNYNESIALYIELLEATKIKIPDLAVDISVVVEYLKSDDLIIQIDQFALDLISNYITPMIYTENIAKSWISWIPNENNLSIFRPTSPISTNRFNHILIRSLLDGSQYPTIVGKSIISTIQGEYFYTTFRGNTLHFDGCSLRNGTMDLTNANIKNSIVKDAEITLSGKCELTALVFEKCTVTFNADAIVKLLDYIPNKYSNLESYFDDNDNIIIRSETTQFLDFNNNIIEI